MTFNEFEQQVRRLIDTFGAQPYKKERVLLIWKECQGLPEQEFKKIVDSFIGNNRQAPLVGDFRLYVSEWREKLRREDKIREEREAKGFYEQVLPDDEIKFIFEQMRKRMQGDMSDEDFKSFQDILKFR